MDDSLVKKKVAMWVESTAGNSVLTMVEVMDGKMVVDWGWNLADCWAEWLVGNLDDSTVKKKAAMWAGSTADNSVLKKAELKDWTMAVCLVSKSVEYSVALTVAD